MRVIYCLTGMLLLIQSARAQSDENNNRGLTLEQCIEYGMENQPALQEVIIAREIANKDVGINLSDWLPQVSATANLQQNLKQQVNVFQIEDQEPQTLTLGTEYTSTIGLAVNQVIFSSDVLMASKTASDYKQQADQNITDAKIDLLVNISKAYYQILTTEQQIAVYDQTIDRLEKNYTDAKNRYEIGVSDRIDYKRAQISLNNTKAQRKAAIETYKAQKALLKQLIGYPDGQELIIADEVEEMETEALLDTTYTPNYTNRIEYQLLQTQKNLSEASISYYKNSYIPSLSAFYNYNWQYLNNEFSGLYDQDFPNSAIGVSLSFPIFQGTRRIKNIQRSKLQYEQLEQRERGLENQFNTEYAEALGTYKSNLEQLQASRENYGIAEEVYETVKLQYDEGIKAYLELIVAESDLRTSQLTYLNALLNVLSSKLDVQKASGTINISNYNN